MTKTLESSDEETLFPAAWEDNEKLLTACPDFSRYLGNAVFSYHSTSFVDVDNHEKDYRIFSVKTTVPDTWGVSVFVTYRDAQYSVISFNFGKSNRKEGDAGEEELCTKIGIWFYIAPFLDVERENRQHERVPEYFKKKLKNLKKSWAPSDTSYLSEIEVQEDAVFLWLNDKDAQKLTNKQTTNEEKQQLLTDFFEEVMNMLE